MKPKATICSNCGLYPPIEKRTLCKSCYNEYKRNSRKGNTRQVNVKSTSIQEQYTSNTERNDTEIHGNTLTPKEVEQVRQMLKDIQSTHVNTPSIHGNIRAIPGNTSKRTYRINDDLWNKLNQYAESNGMTATIIINWLLNEFLSSK